MNKQLAKQLTIAITTAAIAHGGQTDRGGVPYILHCLWVMNRQVTLSRMICGVLHDVVEDTDVTLDDLRAAGLSEPQITTIDLLTQRNGESKDEAIARLIAAKDTTEGQDAIQIKIDDISHNLLLDRLKTIKEGDMARRQHYIKNQALLKEALTFEGFLTGQTQQIPNI